MNRIVITTGDKYFEIDSLACIISYCELLKLQGKDSVAIIRGPQIHNVTDKILKWDLNFSDQYLAEDSDEFIIMDISDPKYISKIVNEDKITALYDHHFGYESYWKEKLGEDAHIEKVGACATLIWEEFEKVGLTNKISTTSANLLYTAIISNTLNFNASVTDERDKDGFDKLKAHVNLPNDWIETYFRDQEMAIYENPEEVIKGDTKIISYPNLPFSLVIGQLELWDSSEFIQKHLEAIEKGLLTFGNPHWFLTSPSISEGKNYIFTKDGEIKNLLEKVLDIKFSGDLAQTEKLILRKEILKKFQEI